MPAFLEALERCETDDFRHFVLLALATGASLAIIGAALGHKSHEATRAYVRLQVDPVRAAMEKAQAAIFDHASANEPGEILDNDMILEDGTELGERATLTQL